MNPEQSMKMLGNGTYTCQTRFSNGVCGVYQHVTVGFVKEIMDGEYRVAVTPSAVREFVQNGHTVYFETGAGLRSGFQDQYYIDAGAQMMQNGQQVYQKSQIMMKVMQPMPQEYEMVQPHQIIFCFMNNNFEKRFVDEMLERRVIIMNYNTLGNNNDITTSPVLNSVMEVSGFMAVQMGMRYLENNTMNMGGNGMIVGNISGVENTRVLILGSGVAALRAATFASNIGASVTLMDIDTNNLRFMGLQLPSNVQTINYSTNKLEMLLKNTDLLIGASINMNKTNTYLVSKESMKMMKHGGVVVDLGMGYNQNFETSKTTTWENPTYTWNNIIHFCFNNITTYVPKTTSTTLSNSVLPYALQVANLGWRKASVNNVELMNGINIVDNFITNKNVSTYTQLTFTPIEQILENDIKHATSIEQNNNGNVWNLKQQLTNLHSNKNTTTSGFCTTIHA